jgi:phage protein D
VLFTGQYTVDEVSVSGTPLQMTIAGKAADMRSRLKERKTRSFSDTTLGDLVATVAADHEMTAKVSDDLASITVAQVDQTNEPDIHLLTRIGADYGAIAKVANGYLLFVKRGQAKSVSGQLIPTVAIQADQVSRYRFTFADRGKYQSVIAHWHNTASGEREPVRAGDGRPAYTLRGSYPDQAAAQAAAAAKLASLQRGEGAGSITLPGDPRLAAEGIVSLGGFMDGVDGDWVASRVEHSLADTFTTSISLEMRK